MALNRSIRIAGVVMMAWGLGGCERPPPSLGTEVTPTRDAATSTSEASTTTTTPDAGVGADATSDDAEATPDVPTVPKTQNDQACDAVLGWWAVGAAFDGNVTPSTFSDALNPLLAGPNEHPFVVVDYQDENLDWTLRAAGTRTNGNYQQYFPVEFPSDTMPMTRATLSFTGATANASWMVVVDASQSEVWIALANVSVAATYGDEYCQSLTNGTLTAIVPASAAGTSITTKDGADDAWRAPRSDRNFREPRRPQLVRQRDVRRTESRRVVQMKRFAILFGLFFAVITTATWLIACSAPNPGSLNEGAQSSTGSTIVSCDTPNTGCACPDEGTLIQCGEVSGYNADGTATCSTGYRRCQNAKWSACSALQDITPAPLSGQANTQALAPSTSCANNPCDPYCQQVGESPDGGFAADGSGVDGAGPFDGGTDAPTAQSDLAPQRRGEIVRGRHLSRARARSDCDRSDQHVDDAQYRRRLFSFQLDGVDAELVHAARLANTLGRVVATDHHPEHRLR